MLKNRFNYQKTKLFLTTALLALLAEPAFADELPALTGAANKLIALLIGVALTLFGVELIYSLFQVKHGHKDWREVIKPILITAIIVSVPVIVVLFRAAMNHV